MKLKQVGSNMTELKLNDSLTVLFSYETPVAYKQVDREGKFNVRVTDQYWSRTTSKHINKWVEGAQTEKVMQADLDALVDNVVRS